MATVPFPIIGYYDKQRFVQFSPEDCANWTLTPAPSGKKNIALFPTMGRHHITYLNQNKLIFLQEPRVVERTVDYWYAVVSNNIVRIDKFYNEVVITSASVGLLSTFTGYVSFTSLSFQGITFAVFADGKKIYVYQEPTGAFPDGQFWIVTDLQAPSNPTYVETFGNRIVASSANSTQFNLSKVYLGGQSFNPATCFQDSNGNAVFAQENGIIRQFAVLNNTLYIFSDFTIGVWSDIPSSLYPALATEAVQFPWKKNTTYDWDFGIADPKTLSCNFNMMVWLAKNEDGLVQVMYSEGGRPKKLSTKAIDILFQRDSVNEVSSPFILGKANGFLYQYEDVIYYRLSAGTYKNSGLLDNESANNSIEYNFESQTWTRVIELNGERNRIQRHVFFNDQHFVTVQDDKTVYEMAGQFYDNEITNPNQPDTDKPDYYLSQPFRYERISPIISEEDYSEFITDYVQIDFVWGQKTFINSLSPFPNAVFIVQEDQISDTNTYLITEDGEYLVTEDANTPPNAFLILENAPIVSDPVFMVTEESDEQFMVTEGSNYPEASSKTYNAIFKPHIELYWSDDGGITFNSADVREFSQLGIYSWRMRWYELGTSRNRCYKLVCVSPAPIVILGGTMDTRRISGGAD